MLTVVFCRTRLSCSGMKENLKKLKRFASGAFGLEKGECRHDFLCARFEFGQSPKLRLFKILICD